MGIKKNMINSRFSWWNKPLTTKDQQLMTHDAYLRNLISVSPVQRQSVTCTLFDPLSFAPDNLEIHIKIQNMLFKGNIHVNFYQIFSP